MSINATNDLSKPFAFILLARSPINSSVIRRALPIVTLCLVVSWIITGCASTQVTTHSDLAANEQLPRPAHIWVYDFVPTASGQAASEQAQIGREIALGVASSINEMGLLAEEALPSTMMQFNDIVLKGYIVSANEGNEAERVALGLGAGASELKVQVEGYQVTPRGLRRIGEGSGDAGGSETPGAALGAVGAIATANPAGLIISTGMKVYGEESGSSKIEGRTKQIVQEISDRLRVRFQEQGWIQ